MKSSSRSRLGAVGILITLMMTVTVISSAVSAQTPLKSEEVEPNLIKPERVEETCPLPAFPEGIDPASGARGAVLVFVTIDSSGYVEKATVRIEQPQGMGFGDAVMKAVSDWQYKPAYWNGKPSKYSVSETFYFEDGKVRLKERDEGKKEKEIQETEATEE